MVVTCDQCGSRYKLADHKITGHNFDICRLAQRLRTERIDVQR